MLKKIPSLLGFGLLAATAGSDAATFRLHGKAWTDAGRIMHSTDTLQVNYHGNWQQGMGMQIGSVIDISPNFEAGIGMGVIHAYHSLGNPEQEKFALSKFMNYVSEARLTWTLGEKEKPLLALTIGDFGYNYAPHAQNLGLYLFRGPVYPGFLVSGFQDFHTDTTRSAFLGFRAHNTLGNFRQDLIFAGEREFAPSFDWSLGYVARFKAMEAIEVGAGVNFYHLIAENGDITAPNKTSVPNLFAQDSTLIADGQPYHPYQLKYMEVVGTDTTVFTHRGTKVMAMFSLDIRRLLDLGGPFGEKDLLLYGEGAIIGLKNYGTIYGKMSERMPVMIGFNVPTFGLLDFLSIEVERYTAKYRQDYSKLGYFNSLHLKNINPTILKAQRVPSAVPLSLKDYAGEKYTITPEGNFVDPSTNDTLMVRGTALDVENMTADDWKWSVNAEKTVAKRVQFSAQVANDHFVPRPVRSGLLFEDAGLSQVLSSTKDWYFMMRVGYSF